MTITELDTLRADAMRAHLTTEGQRYIWQYDIVPAREALAMALDDYDFDNIQAAKAGKPYALIGPGIVDHHFETPEELRELVRWLCRDGYLSSYAQAQATDATDATGGR